MMTLTKPQRAAVKQIYDRHIIGHGNTGARFIVTSDLQSYRHFRRTVTPLLAGGGCAMVQAGGMWIGIETDGHTHT